MTATGIDVAKRWFNDMWNEGQASTITELIHPRRLATRALRHQEGAFSNIVVDIEDTVAADQTVVNRWRATMDQTGNGSRHCRFQAADQSRGSRVDHPRRNDR